MWSRIGREQGQLALANADEGVSSPQNEVC